jgi:hypothetical protein
VKIVPLDATALSLFFITTVKQAKPQNQHLQSMIPEEKYDNIFGRNQFSMFFGVSEKSAKLPGIKFWF